ncbi:hypothetical protein WJX72_009505 [[Myrmecia] bisecta]|uniref:Uncharacterized protein n=1 Tax=[Myrmecia] bisecta TaxID=41462 RepID=A0AAW1P9V7_9CHLO
MCARCASLHLASVHRQRVCHRSRQVASSTEGCPPWGFASERNSMITNHRPSILHRPKSKEPSRKNEENGIVEYEREQERWRVKSEKHAASEDRIRRSLYAMPEDIQRNAQDLTETMKQQLQEKEAVRQHEAEQDAQWARPPAWKCISDNERPWTIASQFVQEQESEEARRAHLRKIAEENRRIMQLRAHQQWQQEQQDRQQAARQTSTEETFWNYGAASEKWIPPERRVKPASQYSHAAHSRASPYEWGAQPPAHAPAPQATVPAWQQQAQQQPAKPGGQGSAQQSLPAREFPWTWHG